MRGAGTGAAELLVWSVLVMAPSAVWPSSGRAPRVATIMAGGLATGITALGSSGAPVAMASSPSSVGSAPGRIIGTGAVMLMVETVRCAGSSEATRTSLPILPAAGSVTAPLQGTMVALVPLRHGVLAAAVRERRRRRPADAGSCHRGRLFRAGRGSCAARRGRRRHPCGRRGCRRSGSSRRRRPGGASRRRAG